MSTDTTVDRLVEMIAERMLDEYNHSVHSSRQIKREEDVENALDGLIEYITEQVAEVRKDFESTQNGDENYWAL